jgi:1,6-anhydro-N-acetylmuramate kinase
MVMGESFINVKSIFSFSSHQGGANEAAMKLLQLRNQAADVQTKRAFALQFELLLAEAWPFVTVRETTVGESIACPLLTPAATSFGNYANG